MTGQSGPADRAVVSEALFLVTVGTIPGTPAADLAQHLADTVPLLPVPAAAMIGIGTMPADISGRARDLGERQRMADAAQDLHLLFARLWFRASAALPADGTEVAVALRALWEEQVRGTESGLMTVVCLPVGESRWMAGARQCRTMAVTTDPAPGLVPGPN
ncbi:hypothetical protein ACFVIM_27395 [Streptomyces sp. NPDC057638]|uniref:hypothetical protein n=1 Tax=Streptomyces sp. NPDC057638 TaxID=3346190 RepID=UPI0036AABF6E